MLAALYHWYTITTSLRTRKSPFVVFLHVLTTFQFVTLRVSRAIQDGFSVACILSHFDV